MLVESKMIQIRSMAYFSAFSLKKGGDIGINEFNNTIKIVKLQDETHLSLVPYYYTMAVSFHIEIRVFKC